MRYYLAGPMSGIAQFNFPKFDRISNELRRRGLEVVSPAELDDAETRAAAMASNDGSPQDAHRSWGDFLARDVKIVADDVGGIILMPGWEKSRGARLEAFVGVLAGKSFLCWDDERSEDFGVLTAASPQYVMNVIWRTYAEAQSSCEAV